jgi:hypothetical protein
MDKKEIEEGHIGPADGRVKPISRNTPVDGFGSVNFIV